MSNTSQFLEELDANGFYLWKSLIPASAMVAMMEELRQLEDSKHARKKDGKTYALRNILNEVPSVSEIAQCKGLLNLVKAVLGNAARPVKATLFDKTAEANWNLRWHQDNVIAVTKKIDVPGFHGWTEKTGIPHVRPPAEILEQMVAVRIHIDDCSQDNGPLIVIPRTHKEGRLSESTVTEKINSSPQVMLPAAQGDVLFMRPLLLHSSKPAAIASHRRVLHLEYAGADLPGGLAWGE